MVTASNKLAVAALAGLLSAGFMSAGIVHADGTDANSAMSAAVKEKHACKGLNSCKGKGADGKNDCKGKGSCRTDGKKPGE